MKHLAVIFSDWHCGHYNQYNKGFSRLESNVQVLNDIGAFCKKNEIKTIFFGGDWFDTVKNLAIPVINKMTEEVLEFKRLYPDITIYYISGNHDHYRKNLPDNPTPHSIEFIEKILGDQMVYVGNDNVHIAEGLTVSGIPYYEFGKHFHTELDNSINRLRSTGIEGKHFLLIHQTPKFLSNSMIPFDTDPFDERYKAFDMTFCGHIHDREVINERFQLVGNPVHRDSADAGKKKGFLVMNLHKPEKGSKFIQLKGYPEFMERFENDAPLDGEEDNFVVTKVQNTLLDVDDSNMQSFNNTTNTESELVKSYWEKVDGEDEELLKTGLSCLQINK